MTRNTAVAGVAGVEKETSSKRSLYAVEWTTLGCETTTWKYVAAMQLLYRYRRLQKVCPLLQILLVPADLDVKTAQQSACVHFM